MPFPANDISKGSYNIMRVRQTFAGAHGIMTAAAYQRAETISARRSGRYISFREDKTDPEEWSILMSVMGVTQEVCAVAKIRSDTRVLTGNRRR